jgi:hypothetical protein
MTKAERNVFGGVQFGSAVFRKQGMSSVGLTILAGGRSLCRYQDGRFAISKISQSLYWRSLESYSLQTTIGL